MPVQDTNYLVFGASESTDGDVHGNHGDRDLWVLKLTPDFDTLWTSCYGPQTENGRRIYLKQMMELICFVLRPTPLMGMCMEILVDPLLGCYN